MPNPPLRMLTALLTASVLLFSGCSQPEPAADLRERIDEILASRNALLRAADLGALLAELPPEALPQVKGAFDAASIDRGHTEVVLLATWWAGFDPEGARDWTTRNWAASHPTALAAVYRTWAQSDPQTAWKQARGLFNSKQQEVASDAVIMGWRASGLPGLGEFVVSLGTDPLGQRVADSFARSQVLALGVEGALRWAEALPDPAARNYMGQRVASAAALTDPVSAARWAEQRIDGGSRTSGMARRVATRWVRRDPLAAMAWLASLPAGGDREDGVTEAYRDWRRLDRSSAVGWIEQQPLEPWLEPALALYARGTLQREDPEAALELVSQFSGIALRNTTATYVTRSWIKRDRAAAEAWLEQSGLPEDVIRRARAVGNQEVLKRRRAHQKQRAQELRAERAPDPTATE